MLNIAVVRVNVKHVTCCLISSSIYVQRLVSERDVCIFDFIFISTSQNLKSSQNGGRVVKC